MRTLAVDPGSNLGWATDATGRLEWGTENFHIKNGESSGNRWRRFGRWLNQVTIPTWIINCQHIGPNPAGPPESHRLVDLIVYERAVFMPKARAAAEIAAGFTTRLEEHCERHGIALQPVAVQTLKAFAIPKLKRKKGDPKLDRNKDAMILAATARIAKKKNYIVAAEANLTEHEADALWAFWWAEENCKC